MNTDNTHSDDLMSMLAGAAAYDIEPAVETYEQWSRIEQRVRNALKLVDETISPLVCSSPGRTRLYLIQTVKDLLSGIDDGRAALAGQVLFARHGTEGLTGLEKQIDKKVEAVSEALVSTKYGQTVTHSILGPGVNIAGKPAEPKVRQEAAPIGESRRFEIISFSPRPPGIFLRDGNRRLDVKIVLGNVSVQDVVESLRSLLKIDSVFLALEENKSSMEVSVQALELISQIKLALSSLNSMSPETDFQLRLVNMELPA